MKLQKKSNGQFCTVKGFLNDLVKSSESNFIISFPENNYNVFDNNVIEEMEKKYLEIEYILNVFDAIPEAIDLNRSVSDGFVIQIYKTDKRFTVYYKDNGFTANVKKTGLYTMTKTIDAQRQFVNKLNKSEI